MRPENTIPVRQVSGALVPNITSVVSPARGQTRRPAPRAANLRLDAIRCMSFCFVLAVIGCAPFITPLALALLIDKTGGGIAKINEHSPPGIVLLRGPARRHHGSRA